MFVVIGLWLALTLIGLVIGIAGYAIFEGMSLVDAYVNAAMILSGMGVRREKAALSNGCKPHPAIAPAGSNRSSHGGNEVAEAFD
jgi:hypothetical protein